MKKVLILETGDFKLSVHTADIYSAYAKARKVHGVVIDSATCYTIVGDASEIKICKPAPKGHEFITIIPGDESHPVFYENKKYGFEIIFNQKVSGRRVYNKIKRVSEDFYRSGSYRIFGSINFGNDIGKSDLVIEYQKNNVNKKFVLTFEVFPVKLNYLSDFKAIIQDIDKRYSFFGASFL